MATTTIKIRRDTANNWEAANPRLFAGEPAYDETNKVMKVGDGITQWNDLPNIPHSDISGLSPAASSHVNNVIILTDAEYNNIQNKDLNTLYFTVTEILTAINTQDGRMLVAENNDVLLT